MACDTKRPDQATLDAVVEVINGPYIWLCHGRKVLRYTNSMRDAAAEVINHGGRVIQQFSRSVFVAEMPDGTDLTKLTASSAAPTTALDPASRMAVEAWTTTLEAKAVRVSSAPSATEGLQWDTPGFEPPLEFAPAVVARSLGLGGVSPSSGTPTSRYLIGSVALGLVLVSRDTGAELMTPTEQTKILQEVQEGLDWLATVEPRASVSFVYDIRPVTISTPPGPYASGLDPYERFERDWRDAALAELGYPGGRPGYQQYANELRADKGTDWSYVAFFTKYTLNHFAYAIFEKVVMSYANDGWGPDNINRVFAHESCHIFGAADEYGSCSCASVSGHLSIPNGNCRNCFPPGAQIACLMNANTLAMCEFSKRQIGWDTSLFP